MFVELGDNFAYCVRGNGKILVLMPDGHIETLGNNLYMHGLKKIFLFISQLTYKQLKVQFYR